jgi:hypothetical protein
LRGRRKAGGGGGGERGGAKDYFLARDYSFPSAGKDSLEGLFHYYSIASTAEVTY